MKTRGTRGGIILSIDADDTKESIEATLPDHRALLNTKVFIEIAAKQPWDTIEVIKQEIDAAGGQLAEIRPPTVVTQARGQTVIIARTVRSGGLVESTGSVIVLGDVNSGAEIIAEDDIIVIGTLRGLAHAGASGNEKAVIWAQQILSPQLRIGAALAQAGDDRNQNGGPEFAHLKDGHIVLRPWDK